MHPIAVKQVKEILVSDDVHASRRLYREAFGLAMPTSPDRLNLARVGSQYLGVSQTGVIAHPGFAGRVLRRARFPSSWRQALILWNSAWSQASRGRVGTSQGCPSASAQEYLAKGWTAKVLGLTIPPSLLARADQVIE